MRARSAVGLSAALCFGAATFVAQSSHAQESTDVAEQPGDVPRDWGLDVGIGGMMGVVGVGGGYGGLSGGGAFGVPVLASALERRLGERVWATLRGGGSYESSDQPGVAMRSWSVDAAVGVRHAVTPLQPLEVSWHGALRGSYAGHYDSSLPATQRAWSAGIDLGITLDKHFTDWFALRLRTDLLQLGYARAISDTPAESWYARVVLAPTLAARFAF